MAINKYSAGSQVAIPVANTQNTILNVSGGDDVSITNGTAVVGQYVSGANETNGAITLTRAALPTGGNQIVHLTSSGQDIPAGGFVISFNSELLRNQSGATITGVTQGTTLTTTGTTPPWQLIQPDGFISGIVESPTGTFTATDDDGATISWTEGSGGGGTTVVANPSGTATSTLAKIGIGPTAIFNTLGVEIATAGSDNNVGISGYGLAKFNNGIVVVNNTQNPFNIVGGPYDSFGDLDSRLNIIAAGNYDADDNPEDGYLRHRDLEAITPFTLSQTINASDRLDLPTARYRRITNADATLALELDFFESNDAAEFYNFIDGQNRPVSPFGDTALTVTGNVHLTINGSTLTLTGKTLDASIFDNQGDRSIRVPITSTETGLTSGASNIRLVKNVVTHPTLSGHGEIGSSDGTITNTIASGSLNQVVTNPTLFDDVVVQQVGAGDARIGTSSISGSAPNRVLTAFIGTPGTVSPFSGGQVSTLTTTGALISNSTLAVQGQTTLSGALIANSTLTVQGQANLNGDVNIGNTGSDSHTVDGNLTLSDGLIIRDFIGATGQVVTSANNGVIQESSVTDGQLLHMAVILMGSIVGTDAVPLTTGGETIRYSLNGNIYLRDFNASGTTELLYRIDSGVNTLINTKTFTTSNI